MNLLRLFGRRQSASVARERLQILLAHERNTNCNSDLIAVLQVSRTEIRAPDHLHTGWLLARPV